MSGVNHVKIFMGLKAIKKLVPTHDITVSGDVRQGRAIVLFNNPGNLYFMQQSLQYCLAIKKANSLAICVVMTLYLHHEEPRNILCTTPETSRKVSLSQLDK